MRNLKLKTVVSSTFVLFAICIGQYDFAYGFCEQDDSNSKSNENDLPNVLILGDSISMGYTAPVREKLAGHANVRRPKENCQSTREGLKNIDRWLGDTEWDVVHFNWGLHDMKYLGPNGENLANPKDSASHQKVPPEEYEKNLEKLVERLKQTGATLVWCSTSPVPIGAKGRVVGDSRKYNDIAKKIMVENGIAITDLYHLTANRLGEIQKKADVHFSKDGSLQLAQHVATNVLGALVNRKSSIEIDFVPLFDGKSLDGWFNVNCASQTWTVNDGMIHCTGTPTGELRTNRMYQNFVLEVEWRHLKPKGNAGIFVWADDITAVGQPFHRGVEVQVLDGREADGYTSDGDVFPIHGATMNPDNGRGGMRAFPTEKRAKNSPEWNHFRITCIDGSIRLAVNGKVVTTGSQCSPRRGYICLESEGSPVDFRNLRIKELPDTPISKGEIAVEETGFTTLYNGLDLTGWKVHEGLVGHWKPNNWQLIYDGKATGDDKNLWSEKSYKDFELIVDWKWNGKYEKTTKRPVVLPSGKHEKDADGKDKTIDVPIADSGIYLRGSQKAQINIWQWPIGSGEVWGYRTDSNMSDEVRAAATPKLKADKPVGQWNRYRIRMVGDELTVVLNGQTVIENAVLPGVPASGPIALQHHGDPITFANIYVREIK